MARGMEIFQGQGACITCHTIQGVSEAGIGPELTSIGVTAATRIPGYTAEEYIIESIRRPGAYVVEGYPRDLMTEALTRHLTEDEVNALAVFLQINSRYPVGPVLSDGDVIIRKSLPVHACRLF